ncbi:MFS transporter [Streptomyces sp. NBC_00344]|uniref:MFS transporter n=1 Tax=Streptomyces sp. NBC_00344 TaxID=2975720 RepID=UPI002E1B2B06
MHSHPLRRRAFRLLFTGRTLSMAGDAVIPVALALAIQQATDSAAALAVVLACAMIPKLLLLPMGGVVGDRFNARTVALTTDLVRCATQLFVGAELLSGQPHLAHLAVAEAIGGAAGAFAIPTSSPLVVGTVDGGDLLRANSLMGVAGSATRLGGPALGGLLVATAGPGWAFVLDGATFAASAALLAVITVARVPVPRSSVLSDLKEGWAEVRSRDWYWTSLIGHSTWNGAAAVLMTLGPGIAVHELGGKWVWVWTLQSGTVGLLLGSLLASRARPRRPVLVANMGLALYAVPLGLMALHAHVALIIAAYGLALAGLGFLSPVWETAVQSAVPAHALARVDSYDWLLSLAAMPIGYAVAPMAASAWGPGTPLAFAAGAVALTCLGTAAVPGVRRFTGSTGRTGPPTRAEASAPRAAPAP